MERQKKKKSKKVGKVILQSAIALVVAIVLVISSCGLTAVLTSAYWKNQWNQQFGILLQYVSYKTLFPYAMFFTACAFYTMTQVKHGDSRPAPRKTALEHFDVDD